MTQDLHALARRWYDEVWNKRMTSTLDELMSQDCVGQMEGAEINGREQFKKASAALLEAFPDIRIEVVETIAEGDNVVTRWRAKLTHLGDAFGIAATGASTDVRGMTWMKVADGRIVRGWDSWNQGALIDLLREKAKLKVQAPSADA